MKEKKSVVSFKKCSNIIFHECFSKEECTESIYIGKLKLCGGDTTCDKKAEHVYGKCTLFDRIFGN